MTQGYPLILARHSRRPDPDAMSSWITETTGSPEMVGIEFTDGEPRFTCRRGTGHFLCVLQSTTEREDLRMEVSAPSSAAQPWNVVECKKVTWDQIISIPVTQSGSRGSIMTLGTPDTMVRELVCNSHLALEWLVELDEDEECVVDVTGDPLRSWELAVIRMLPEGVNEPFVEHPNVVWATNPAVSGSGWTRTELDPSSSLRTGKLFRFYRITNTSAGSFAVAWMAWAINSPATGYDHDTIVKIRKSATHAGGGSIRVRIQNAAGTVDYVTETVTIPTDDSEVEVVYNGPAGGPFGVRVFLDTFAIGEQVEIAVGCLVVS